MDAFYPSDLPIFHLGAPPRLFAFSVIIFTPNSTGEDLFGTMATSTCLFIEHTVLSTESQNCTTGGKLRDHWVQSPCHRDEETTPGGEGICLRSTSELVARSRIRASDSQSLFTSSLLVSCLSLTGQNIPLCSKTPSGDNLSPLESRGDPKIFLSENWRQHFPGFSPMCLPPREPPQPFLGSIITKVMWLPPRSHRGR